MKKHQPNPTKVMGETASNNCVTYSRTSDAPSDETHFILLQLENLAFTLLFLKLLNNFVRIQLFRCSYAAEARREYSSSVLPVLNNQGFSLSQLPTRRCYEKTSAKHCTKSSMAHTVFILPFFFFS